MRQWHKDHPDARKKYSETYLKKHGDAKLQKDKQYRRTMRGRFSIAKNLARRRNKEWILSFEEYETIAVLPCHYCNNILGKVEAGGGIDRIDNDRGYSVDNVVSCCGTCNKIKNDSLNFEEAKKVICVILEMRGLTKRSPD